MTKFKGLFLWCIPMFEYRKARNYQSHEMSWINFPKMPQICNFRGIDFHGFYRTYSKAYWYTLAFDFHELDGNHEDQEICNSQKFLALQYHTNIILCMFLTVIIMQYVAKCRFNEADLLMIYYK